MMIPDYHLPLHLAEPSEGGIDPLGFVLSRVSRSVGIPKSGPKLDCAFTRMLRRLLLSVMPMYLALIGTRQANPSP